MGMAQVGFQGCFGGFLWRNEANRSHFSAVILGFIGFRAAASPLRLQRPIFLDQMPVSGSLRFNDAGPEKSDLVSDECPVAIGFLVHRLLVAGDVDHPF